MHLRLVNLVSFLLYTMRNGSIVHGESTFKSRLTSLNEGKPYMYIYIYFFLFFNILQPSSRKSWYLMYVYFLFLVKRKSMKHTTHTLPPPSPSFLFAAIANVLADRTNIFFTVPEHVFVSSVTLKRIFRQPFETRVFLIFLRFSLFDTTVD